MKLIGAGLPRTGTLSQKVALEILGYGPTYHMVNVLANLDLVDQWRSALQGDGQWDEIFDGFEATVDWPGSFFYRELSEIYPDAKVLLSVRDGESWSRSMRDTIWGVIYGDILLRHLSDSRCVVDPKWRGYTNLMDAMWRRIGLNGQDVTPEQMVSGMERYNEEVRQTLPADRLLVWSVTDGWKPLCDFLEVSVPDEAFPHLNDSKVFAERVTDGALGVLQQWRAETEDVTAAATASTGREQSSVGREQSSVASPA
ncbi:MAG: hypothetical protein JO321_09090 [Solirubrobacterales bacterium]|nr:hypothetical protein [Solirubrobacterales bacterium]